MELRNNLYISGLIAGTVSYLFNVTAFTGSIEFIRLAVFIAFFIPVMFGFEKFIDWAMTLEEPT